MTDSALSPIVPDLPICDASLRKGASFLAEIMEGMRSGQIAYGQYAEYTLIAELINRMRLPLDPKKPVPPSYLLYSGWYSQAPPVKVAQG